MIWDILPCGPGVGPWISGPEAISAVIYLSSTQRTSATHCNQLPQRASESAKVSGSGATRLAEEIPQDHSIDWAKKHRTVKASVSCRLPTSRLRCSEGPDQRSRQRVKQLQDRVRLPWQGHLKWSPHCFNSQPLPCGSRLATGGPTRVPNNILSPS